MLIIIGYTGSGKDSVGRLLQEEDNFTKIIEVTSRPKRDGEEEGKQYKFTTLSQFNEDEKHGQFAVTSQFNHFNHGLVKYGILWEDIHKASLRSFIISNALSVKKLQGMNLLKDKDVICKLKVSREACMARLFNRGDDIAEIYRRLDSDITDLREIEEDFFINTSRFSLEDVKYKVYNYYKEILAQRGYNLEGV